MYYLEGEGTTTCCTSYMLCMLYYSRQLKNLLCMPCHECTPHACICVCTYICIPECEIIRFLCCCSSLLTRLTLTFPAVSKQVQLMISLILIYLLMLLHLQMDLEHYYLQEHLYLIYLF